PSPSPPHLPYTMLFRSRSSNVASSKLVWEVMDTDVYLDYLKQFELDKKTNIDLPSEVEGKILFDWPAEKLTTSFGQGSTTTPIQDRKSTRLNSSHVSIS